MEGIAFGEQPRWHEDRLWFSDWGPPEVIAVDLEGNHEVRLPASSFPFVQAWLLGWRDPRPQSSMSPNQRIV
jgi:sugar lactone lactonase YvrE